MKDIVLVTGSCGRIGSNVVKRLSGEFHVLGLELPKAPCLENIIPVDLSSDESVIQAFAKIPHRHIASVIHLAAYYSFDQKHSDLYEKVTVRGTERLLKALQNYDVDQFLFSSTMLVHAPTQPGHPISESSPVKPNWDYPLSKVHTEELIHRLRGKMSTVILRIAGVYDDHCHSIPISHQIQRIYEKKLEAHLFSGDIHHGAAFMHMDDLIDAIELAVRKRKELPHEVTLLLGEPKTWSYDQLQRMISSLIYGKEFKTWRIPKPIAKLGAWAQGLIGNPFIKPWMIDLADNHYELDISRAKKILGWSPKHNLESTLPKMIAELKANADAWYKANQLKL
jgi:nucleoside-diphosphate-sugar epimerase